SQGGGSGFVGRAGALGEIVAYRTAESEQPLVVRGPSGSGKSTLLARVAEQARAETSVIVIERYVGATAASTDGYQLLRGLYEDLGRRLGQSGTAPSDQVELALAVRNRIATADAPVVLVLDALDRLAGTDPIRSLTWMPPALP